MIAGKGITTLLEWTKRELTKDMLSYVNHELIRNFSLDRVIQSVTILDTEKIIRQVEVFLIQLEERWQQTIQNDRKLAVYVHVSCLIERLIRNEPIENYNGAEQLKQCQRTVLQELKEAFSVIEKVYSVNIPESELFMSMMCCLEKRSLTTQKAIFKIKRRECHFFGTLFAI